MSHPSKPRRYRLIPDGSGKRALVIRFRGVDGFEVKWTECCSGCTEIPECTEEPERGAGCRECGYTGKSRRVAWVPFDMAEDERARLRREKLRAALGGGE